VGLTTPHSKKTYCYESWIDLKVMERVGDRWGKMEGYCSTGQSPQRAVVPMEEEEEELLLSLNSRTQYFKSLHALDKKKEK
jgi:hypothetical protein